MLQNAPKLINAIKAEKRATECLINEFQNIDGIISDNRFGVYSKDIPSVFITHQLKVLSGNTTWLSTKMHQNIINRFDECWVPDSFGDDNLSGTLSQTRGISIPVKYIGPLSRFKKSESTLKYDLMVLLSGPEPQRTILEELLSKTLIDFNGNILFVKGIIEGKSKATINDTMTIYNFMTSKDLEKALNESKIILSRSGYTTVMDLAKLEKKAFFIPTPGQFEQEYIAKRLTNLSQVPSCNQDEFKIEFLKTVDNFSGLKPIESQPNYKELFSLFERK